MKSINLLKEGRGLRFASAEELATDEPVLSVPRKGGGGKAFAALLLVVLVAGGAWWGYRTFDQWSPRVTALRQLVAGRLASKPQVSPPPSPATKPKAEPKAEPQPTVAKAPPPPPSTAPEPPALPGVTAAELERWYRADRAYPFSILVASFRKEASATAYAGRLASAGHPATVAPTDLGELGRWHRVVLGRHESRSEVRQAAARLKGKDPIDNAIAFQLPYAVEVGRKEEKGAAEAAREAISAKGFVAYLFPEAAGPEEPVTFLVLVGAYASKDQAEAFATTLRQAGLEATVVTP
ncbi:MAG: SPOR domain-containing protein [bacterium]|nr:SPOR domain-containing protein [bacterium]